MSELNQEIFSSPEKFQQALKEAQNSAVEQTIAPQEKIENTQNIEVVEKQELPDSNEVQTNENVPADNDASSSNDNENLESSEDEPVGKNNFIPKSRFNKEIEKRRALELALQQERESRIKYEAQLELMNKSYQNEPTMQYQQEEAIDPLDDQSHKYYMNKISGLESRFNQMNEQLNQRAEQLENQTVLMQQENEFKQSHPDFKEALQHIYNVETRIAQNIYGKEEAKQIVGQKLNGILADGLRTGRNVPEMMYEVAKSYGYRAKTEQAPIDKPKTNLSSINSNMNKSAGISNIGASASPARGNYDVSAMLNDPSNPHSGINEKAFKQLLSKSS